MTGETNRFRFAKRNQRPEARTSDPDIGPEDDRNITYGVVFEPSGFLEGLTITVDRWDICRENVVGVFGAVNHISLDLVQRLNGSTNPNVLRADPTVDDIAFFAGTGLTLAGQIIRIFDSYENNETQSVTGTDFALMYDLDDTHLVISRSRSTQQSCESISSIYLKAPS